MLFFGYIRAWVKGWVPIWKINHEICVMILQQLTNHILVFTQNAYINQVMLYSYQYTNRMSWKICIIAVKLYLVKQIIILLSQSLLQTNMVRNDQGLWTSSKAISHLFSKLNIKKIKKSFGPLRVPWKFISISISLI